MQRPLCCWWRDLPVLVVDQLEDGRVEAYVRCSRRMLSPEEAMHLSRQGPATSTARQKQQAKDWLVHDQLIDRVDRLEQSRRNSQPQQAQRSAEKEARQKAKPAPKRKPAPPPVATVLAAPRPAAPPRLAAVAPAAAPKPAPVAAAPLPAPPAAAPQQKPARQRRAGRRVCGVDDAIRASLEAFWQANRTPLDSAHS